MIILKKERKFMKNTITYYPKGTTVYYFNGLELLLKETIVEHIHITISDSGDEEVVYTLDSGKSSISNVKLPARHVFDDREKLKEKVLGNFETKEKASEEKIEA